MSQSKRDSQQRKVWEMTLLAAGGGSFNCTDDCHAAEAYVREAIDLNWFSERFGEISIEVRRGHAHLKYPSASLGGPIELPRGLVSEMQLVHELAHCVQPAGTAGHGPEFVRIFFDLVEHLMGPEYLQDLENIAIEDGISVAPRESSGN